MFIVMESRNPKLQRSGIEMNMSPHWGFSSFGVGGYNHVASELRNGSSVAARTAALIQRLCTPALFPRRGRTIRPCFCNVTELSGWDCNRNVQIFQHRAIALPLLGERVGVRGNEANSDSRRTTTPGTVKLRESPGRAGGFPVWL